jgi:Domain of unknown function (DUF1737)
VSDKAQYMILEAPTRIGLQKKVRSAMAEGWNPQGGVSVIAVHRSWTQNDGTDWVFYQAMIRPELPAIPFIITGN